MAAFEALSFTHRKEYARAVADAKKPETRDRRVAQTIEKLRDDDREVMSESNVELARGGYEAIMRGDLDAIGELLDPDVKWHGGDPCDTAARIASRRSAGCARTG